VKSAQNKRPYGSKIDKPEIKSLQESRLWKKIKKERKKKKYMHRTKQQTKKKKQYNTIKKRRPRPKK